MRNGFLKMEKQIYGISITQVHNVTQTLAWHLIFFVCYLLSLQPQHYSLLSFLTRGEKSRIHVL